MVVGDVDTVGTFNWTAWKSSMEHCCSSLRWALGADGCSAAICNGRWGLRSHSSVSWALLLGLPAVSYALLSWQILGQMDNEAAINQTELQLSIRDHEEEAEEEEESDSWGRKESKTVFNTDSGISSPFLPTDIHVVLCGLYDMLGSWSPRRLPLRTQMLQAWQTLN